jgi:hypothetical protein
MEGDCKGATTEGDHEGTTAGGDRKGATMEGDHEGATVGGDHEGTTTGGGHEGMTTEGNHEGMTTEGDHRAVTAKECCEPSSVLEKGGCKRQSHGVTMRCNHEGEIAGWGRWEVSPHALCVEDLVGGQQQEVCA